MEFINYEDILDNKEFTAYVKKAGEALAVRRFTDHSQSHTKRVAFEAEKILLGLKYDKRKAELAKIAGYIHDIGNMINRTNHEQTGAVIAMNVLTRMGMDPDEIGVIAGAIGNHDEGTGHAISPESAAVIIADKSDIRRSRIMNKDKKEFDRDDWICYSVEEYSIETDYNNKTIILDLKMDTSMHSSEDYLKLFGNRMLMCKKAAMFLNTEFHLYSNEIRIL